MPIEGPFSVSQGSVFRREQWGENYIDLNIIKCQSIITIINVNEQNLMKMSMKTYSSKFSPSYAEIDNNINTIKN